MATVRWTGSALPVAQVATLTVGGSWSAADTLTVTANGKSLVLTLGTDRTTTQVATALKEMLNGDTQTGTGDHTFSETGDNVGEFLDFTATSSAAVVTLTANVKGVPFTISVGETGASGTLTLSLNATSPSGPYHWSTAANWSGGSVPVSTDDVVIDVAATIKYGLDQSAVTLTSLLVKGNVKIGLPATNSDNSVSYTEYRDTHLKIGATTCNLDITSTRCKINFGTVATTCTVRGSGSGVVELEPVDLVGTNTTNVFEIQGGVVSLGGADGTAVNYATLNQTGGVLRVGTGGVHTAAGVITIRGGTALIDTGSAGLKTLNILKGASCTVEGSSTLTTTDVGAGGTLRYKAMGNITTATGPGTFDFSGTLDTMTVSTFSPEPGARLIKASSGRPGLTTHSFDADVTSITYG